MQFKSKLKKIVFSIPFLKKRHINKLHEKGHLIPYENIDRVLNEAAVVLLDYPIKESLKVGLVKDGNEYEDEGYTPNNYYFQKYERFLKNNSIKYEYYNILSDDWIKKADELDFILWHTKSDPITQDIAENKIYLLDKIMGKTCLPSFDEIWSFENKVNLDYLYKAYKLPVIPTFVSFEKKEALEYIKKCKYPIISKHRMGYASLGVSKINNLNQARKLVNKVFSYKGIKSVFFHDRQKNYVYFQEFISDASFDLRVIVVGDKAFGYYRYPNNGDFRASGSGNIEKKEIPTVALDLAFRVKKCFKSTCLATDLLYSQKKQKYFIIESTIFPNIRHPKQLEIDGISGYYKRQKNGEYIFEEGKYWIQELALKEVFKKI